MRVLFAWELGANYGHLARAAAITQRLRAEGCGTLVAARDVEYANSLLTPGGIEFVAAPHYRGPGRALRSTLNYSDLLGACGYHDPSTLRALLRAWLTLLRTTAPDALVIDHAPTALLAAKVLGIPRVLVGTGFTVPPAGNPMPPLLAGARDADLRAADARVLSCINRALEGIGHPGLERVAALFTDAPVVLTTFRELDHYRDRENATYVGPVSPPRQLPAVKWPGSSETRVLAYLNADFPQLADLLSALRQIDADALCVIPGVPEMVTRRFSSDRLAICDSLVDIASLLRQATVVVTHCGAGLATQALAAGVPLLCIPRFVEQEMPARRIADLGAALVVGAQRSSADFKNALAHLLAEPSFVCAARSLASKFAQHDPRHAVDTIAQTILRVAQRPSVAASA